MDDTNRSPLIKNPLYQPPKAITLNVSYNKLIPTLSSTVVPPKLKMTKEDVNSWCTELEQEIEKNKSFNLQAEAYTSWLKEQSTKVAPGFEYTIMTPSKVKSTSSSRARYNLRLEDARDHFENAIYTKWKVEQKTQKISEFSLSKKCDIYFSNINKQFQVDLEFWNNLQIDPVVYKKKKWVKERTRAIKKQYKRKNWKTEYNERIAQEYARESAKYASYEKQIFDEINHMRVFGKCYDEISDASCSRLQEKLFPWIKGNMAKVENYNGESLSTSTTSNCFLKAIQQSSIGRGIVIPITSEKNQQEQVDHIVRLLRCLRLLQNKLPVSIAYRTLSDQDKAQLITAARDTTNGDTVPQDILFIDLSTVTDYPVDIATLGLIFNPFRDVVLLSEHTIPLTDLESLFNERYKSSGAYFFKYPSLLNKAKATPGFYEITNFMKNVLSPQNADNDFFELRKTDSSVSRRFYEEDFQTVLDSNLMILDKHRALSGLLISASLKFYEILNLRVKQADYLWIGQEMAGSDFTFHYNYPVMSGVLSPDNDSEICSSSFSQLSDTDDISLICTTTHQLQNWLKYNYSFKAAFKAKYLTKATEHVDDTNKEGTATGKQDYSTLHKIYANPLFFENIIKPPTLKRKVNVKTFDEQSEAWVEQKKHVSARVLENSEKYYCVYSVVGDPFDGGEQGPIIHISNHKREFYNNVTAAWLRSRN
ncbi:hypothetical protein KGF56_001130 [Candida oxycetoniae]|uniref:Uncharacterized protein n=1 Tax=Candida oxycetoniae TaxID=497107 RepID=A0AAI9T0E8_9ASCO|nr:uncharacterized protein KGF56_001130 [Candida oxycetoniae]KAI3405911.2 hypothetical protein KGF56_001130 [Candida oxycetoniae]